MPSRSLDGVGADSLTGRPELFGHIHRGHEVQKLSKGNLDTLVGRLRRGEAEGRKKTWTPRSVNYLVYLTTAVLDDQVKQGNVVRNVARLVDRVAGNPRKYSTLTTAAIGTCGHWRSMDCAAGRSLACGGPTST